MDNQLQLEGGIIFYKPVCQNRFYEFIANNFKVASFQYDEFK